MKLPEIFDCGQFQYSHLHLIFFFSKQKYILLLEYEIKKI